MMIGFSHIFSDLSSGNSLGQLPSQLPRQVVSPTSWSTRQLLSECVDYEKLDFQSRSSMLSIYIYMKSLKVLPRPASLPASTNTP